MKMNKWVLLGALACGFTVAVGQAAAQEVRTLDIVIRDFQPTHPDFENFSEESVEHINEIYNYRTATGAEMKYFGYDLDWYNAAAYHNTCGTEATFNKFGVGAQIGTDGIPMQENPYLPEYLRYTSFTKEVLKYGECEGQINGLTYRGYMNAQSDVSGFKCPNGKTAWANPVIYTPGMVGKYLTFTQFSATGAPNMYDGVVISKANERCDNQNFVQWFADVPGVNKHINTTMDIPKDPNGSKYFIYDYNYNNGGYSPLDSIDPVTKEWLMNKPCNPKMQPNEVCDQYEPQTLSIFCPPYDYQYNKNQADYRGQNTYDLCTEWLNQGGPRAMNSNNSGHSAAWQAAVAYKTQKGSTLGFQHLRNYAFTMMGYASFKYKSSNQVDALGNAAHEVFEFAGDDDMWIFVDGVLVVDLGGTHLAAPGKVDIEMLARNNHGCHAGEPLANHTNCKGASDGTGWADETWHHLHFFYADRQSDGSNIYIRTSLAELAPSRYGQPRVSSVTVKVDENGNANNSMFMNVPLADSTLNYIRTYGKNVPTMIVLREVTDVNGVKQTVVLGYYVESIDGPYDKGADGLMYQFTGKVKLLDDTVLDGGLLGDDRIAFNVPWSQGLDDDGNTDGIFTKDEWSQLMSWSKKMFRTDAAGQLVPIYIASSTNKIVEGFDEKDKWGKITYTAKAVTPVVPGDLAYDRPDFVDQAEKLTNIAGSGTIPVDMTADLVLTPVPAVSGFDPLKWATDSAKVLMQSGTENSTVVTNGVVYGASETTGGAANSTLCYNDGLAAKSGSSSNESCASWSFSTTQPFHVNIRVFDHLGHFVNQYSKHVTGEEFKNALMGVKSSGTAAGTPVSSCGDTPLYGSTGAMLATIKMYPVTDKGRLLATGPYIYQMTVVKEDFSYCYMSQGNNPTVMTMPFQRTTETYRRGYRRTAVKK